ncbi:reverse transcriptase domain-containing protein [Tanacetum coccineum]|uniref:Reverse transcriptase domain-containing protein n=1 Tax=Tanacetum coccineum TaxID=301880 RepID=A0ABQ5FE80_9ASTR
MHTRASNSELVEPLPEPERTLNRIRRRRNRRVPFDQRNNPPKNPRIVYPSILNINHFHHFLNTLKNLFPMDDEPMWAADRVVAPTPGFAITIPKTANEFAIKGSHCTNKMERWAMPTWCHMFNSTLTGNARVWFDDLLPESIDSYDDLREAFLKNYIQQKKCIRDPIVLYNIKKRDGESTEDFIQRYKSESRNVKGASECMRISGFVHGITNPELIKRFHEKIPKTVDEMMQVATSFLQGQEAALNQERKKTLPT